MQCWSMRCCTALCISLATLLTHCVESSVFKENSVLIVFHFCFVLHLYSVMCYNCLISFYCLLFVVYHVCLMNKDSQCGSTHNNPLKIWWNVLARIAVYDTVQKLLRFVTAIIKSRMTENTQPETE